MLGKSLRILREIFSVWAFSECSQSGRWQIIEWIIFKLFIRRYSSRISILNVIWNGKEHMRRKTQSLYYKDSLKLDFKTGKLFATNNNNINNIATIRIRNGTLWIFFIHSFEVYFFRQLFRSKSNWSATKKNLHARGNNPEANFSLLLMAQIHFSSVFSV